MNERRTGRGIVEGEPAPRIKIDLSNLRQIRSHRAAAVGARGGGGVWLCLAMAVLCKQRTSRCFCFFSLQIFTSTRPSYPRQMPPKLINRFLSAPFPMSPTARVIISILADSLGSMGSDVIPSLIPCSCQPMQQFWPSDHYGR